MDLVLDHKIELGYRKTFLIFLHKSLGIGKCDLEVENECSDFLSALWS